MAAKNKNETAEDEAIKARKRAKLMKDDDSDSDDEGEEMECSDDGDDDDDDSKDSGKGKRGKKLPWMKSKKSKKSRDDDENMDEDEDGGGDDADDEDEGDDDDMDKSETYSVDKLNKALAYLEDYQETHDNTSRKDALFAKSYAGETLTKSEKRELMGLIDGTGDLGEAESLGKSAAAALNEEVGDTIEISDFLKGNHDGMCSVFEVFGNAVDSLKKSQLEHNLLMARAQVEIGTLLKALVEDRQAEVAQPARAPKARGVASPLQKSFGAAKKDEVDYGTIKKALNEMAAADHAAGGQGLSKSGHDIGLAMAMFEGSGQMPANIAEDVKEYLRNNRKAG